MEQNMSNSDADTHMNGTDDVGDSVTVQMGSLANENGDSSAPTTAHPPRNADVPKPKRLACMICRKRKLRCDGNRPRCSTCTRLGHDCAYDEVRRKSGPKRGYVKALEERLKQVETLLKTQEPPAVAKNVTKDPPSITVSPNPDTSENVPPPPPPMVDLNVPDAFPSNKADLDRWNFTGDNSPQPPAPPDSFDFSAIPMTNNFTWEMIGLGLEEPLPPQESIDEFHQIYFEKIHPSMPMIHKYRYLAAMNLAPAQRPPVCLRYAIWTLACSVHDKFADLRDLFYQRARKYVEADYVKGFGEHLISVAHAQTHVLLSQYEFKMMYFPRAWMSTGSAVRLCQMMGLHRLDGSGLDVKMCIPAPRDWTEKEERRRTFWMAFTEDRYASIGTGWPMSIDEKDIMTNMPSSEDAFEMSRPEQTQSLRDSMTPAGAEAISTMGGIVLMGCLFGRNLLHLHRPDVDDRDHDLNGEFWKRHRNIDNILLNTSLCLPTHLKLPGGLSNPNVIFTNMCIHTSTICLHQAAIFKADKNRLPPSVSSESKVRCITAANEIASIMRMISHIDLSTMNPFTSFCLYVAARVFVQYLKSRPDETQIADSLRFLLAAMGALKRRNPLTESFLVQLDVDLEALAVHIPKLKQAFPRNTEIHRSSSGMPGVGPSPHNMREPKTGVGIIPRQQDCNYPSVSTDNSKDQSRSPDIIEIDPSLTGGAPQHPIPAFKGLSSPSPWMGDASRRILTRMRQSNGPGFGKNMMQDLINPENVVDLSLSSPDGGQSSDRPTPSSSTSQQNTNSGSHTAANTSPESQSTQSNNGSTAQQAQRNRMQNHQVNNTMGLFQTLAGSGADMPIGLEETPRNVNSGEMGNEEVVAAVSEAFSWDTFGGGVTGGSAMTPMSESVLKTMLSMGPMETMEIFHTQTWTDNPPSGS